MRTWSFERLGAAAGIVFIVLNLISGFIAGTPPGTDDSPAKIAGFFNEHHRAVTVSVILSGIGGPLFVLLIAAIALRLRALGMTAWAGVAFGLGLVGVALGVVSDAIYGSLARVATTAGEDVTKSVYQVDGFVAAKSFWFAVGVMIAVAVAAWHALPRWYGVLSLVAAVGCALGGIAVKAKGFAAPLGDLTSIAFLALLVWVAATAVVLWLSPESPGRRPELGA